MKKQLKFWAVLQVAVHNDLLVWAPLVFTQFTNISKFRIINPKKLFFSKLWRTKSWHNKSIRVLSSSCLFYHKRAPKVQHWSANIFQEGTARRKQKTVLESPRDRLSPKLKILPRAFCQNNITFWRGVPAIRIGARIVKLLAQQMCLRQAGLCKCHGIDSRKR